ncbi:DUF6950 family protein [Sphingomonas hengshuiensis]|uniref:DUF6950 domain-containing protein n=1 Tax=Sphingomonas hengshuiensis TaxID=1609977 RepID=A0A7U4J9X4_9SPHN|nr:hypothetical protein [Sphingomonas hengshuiensis]AJP72923.1 hypothetical protein TS85_15685 [Sphingomonas hengshuiensis]
MQRLPDWEARLAAYLEPLRARPFEWGRHDCCAFTFGAVEAMTGVDAMAEYRGRYRTARGSVRALRRIGAGTLEASVDAKFARIGAGLAQRGDIVMSSGLLGICLGRFLVAVGSEGAREGLVRIDRARWVDPIAWRVPFAG